MNPQVRNRIRKALAYIVSGTTFLVVSAFLVLQIPAVQDSLIKRYLRSFSKVTGFDATVGSFQLLWFDKLEIRKLKVTDPSKNEMILAETITINFTMANLFSQQDVNIDGVLVEGANVLVTKVPESDTSTNLNFNVFINAINEAYAGEKKGGRTPHINIGEAIINGSRFSYIDQEKDSIKTGFNYNQFSLDIDESQLQNFTIIGDTTQFDVRTLLVQDRKTGFEIKQLSTFFRLSQRSMEFLGLQLHAGQSVISDTVVFEFDGQRELSDFLNKVNVYGNITETIIEPKDLALFAPAVARLKKPIYVQGKFKGRINNFRTTDLEIETGGTTLRGSLDMDGLPDIEETFILLRLRDSKIDFHDIGFLFEKEVLEQLTSLGSLQLQGEFLGYPTDFVANGDFSGKLGRIISDINFKVNENNFNLSTYSGKLALHDFNVGEYLKDTANFQRVTLNGNIRGSGLSVNTADFKLNGKVSSIGIKKYNYKNITTNARFASQLFNGFIKINDPNLQFQAEGTIDIRDRHESIKIKAQLDTAFLHKLKLSSEPIFLHSLLDVDINGLHIDSIAGNGDLTDFKIIYNDKHLSLKDIHLQADRKQNRRSLQLNSNVVDAEIEGDFLLSDISRDIKTLMKEISLNVVNDQEEIAEYYRTKNYRPKSYQADFNIKLKDVQPVTGLLNTPLSLTRNTKVEGKFTSGYTTILQAFGSIDSVFYDKSTFVNTTIELNASKIADSTSVLAMAFLNSEQQILSPQFSAKNLLAEAIWNKNHIDFSFEGDQEGQNNYVRLKGAVDFHKDSTLLKVSPSTIKVLEKVWKFHPDNLITITGKDVDIFDLTLENENQFVSINGDISEDPEKSLLLKVNEFDLSTLNPITGKTLTGDVNAAFELRNLYNNPTVENDLLIDSLTIDNFLVGNISGKNHWDTIERRFILDFFVDRNGKRIVDLGGYYDPARKENPLSLSASLQNANLNILQPFLEDMFSEIAGTVTGDFTITGQLSSPQINGEGNIGNGQIMIDYLRTVYSFKGIIGLTPRSIDFRNIDLTDMFGNQGRLNGSITHLNFYGMRLNIDASFSNFQVLNTMPRDNSLFYGQGYATGDLNIFGPVSNLRFTANARTEKNTRIYIPIGTDSEVERKEFIKFASFSDSTFQQSLSEAIEEKVDLTGITMDFNLDVTPDAYCEIILDLKAGDIIRGRGNGELQLQFDTKGEFNMFGPFEFTEGFYNFTLKDIVNKDFVINRGSRITWFGDPYQGIVDISASYNQNASFAPLLTNYDLTNAPQARRNYPVKVLLELDGPMLSPDIDFDIVTENLPANITLSDQRSLNLEFEFQAFKNRIDEQELKRQVFSLIVLRRFSPPESFNTSGTVASSLTELFSNQLSNWLSQVDENLEIDIDLSTLDQEAFNTFQLRLSYTFFNGRLRVTRDQQGYYGNQSASAVPVQQNTISTIAGDWTVEYLLTADGKFKVKMYNRTNLNPLYNSLNAQNTVTTGASISHTQSFNELRDIWRSSRKRKDSENTESRENNNEEAVLPKQAGTR